MTQAAHIRWRRNNEKVWRGKQADLHGVRSCPGVRAFKIWFRSSREEPREAQRAETQPRRRGGQERVNKIHREAEQSKVQQCPQGLRRGAEAQRGQVDIDRSLGMERAQCWRRSETASKEANG